MLFSNRTLPIDGNAIYSDLGDNLGGGSAWDYGLSGNIGWELDFWGKFRRGIESADAAFFASLANYDATLVLLVAHDTALGSQQCFHQQDSRIST